MKKNGNLVYKEINMLYIIKNMPLEEHIERQKLVKLPDFSYFDSYCIRTLPVEARTLIVYISDEPVSRRSIEPEVEADPLG